MAEETVSSVESTICEIHRRTRKEYSAEEKMRIVLEDLRGENQIAELCHREGAHQNMYTLNTTSKLNSLHLHPTGEEIRGNILYCNISVTTLT